MRIEADLPAPRMTPLGEIHAVRVEARDMTRLPKEPLCMQIDPTVVVAAITALSAGLGTIARMVYLDLRKDRDFWRDTALAALRHTDKALDITEKRADGA